MEDTNQNSSFNCQHVKYTISPIFIFVRSISPRKVHLLDILLEQREYNKFFKIIEGIPDLIFKKDDLNQTLDELVKFNVIKKNIYVAHNKNGEEILVKLRNRRNRESCPFCNDSFSNEKDLYSHLYKNHLDKKKVRKSHHLRPLNKSEQIEKSLKNVKNENVNEKPLPKRKRNRHGKDYVNPEDALNFTLPGSYESSKNR